MTIAGTVAGFTSNEAGVSDIRVSEDITVAGTVDVSGADIHRAGIRVTGSGNVSTTFDVSGITTLRDEVRVGGSNFGLVVRYPAGGIISGGAWVSLISGASDAVQSAAASESGTIGVNVTTVASGGTASVMIYGIRSFAADTDISAGDKVVVGAGAARNTVASVGSPYTAAETFAVVGRALQARASGATVLVALGI